MYGKYSKGKKLGEGQFGVVSQGKDEETGRVVALKKIRLGKMKDGMSVDALREIKILQEIKHPNVVELVDVITHKQNPILVFEYLQTDVEVLIKSRTIVLRPGDIKCIMKQLLEGVKFLHDNFILHRDLKPSNLLISPDGLVKIADFGLARTFGSPNRNLTHQVVTRWYRAPELLFGARRYGYGVDMWAVGCIFAELMLRTPYFPGESDIDQLSKIFAALGTPTEENWPGMTTLPDYMEFEQYMGTPLNQLFTAAGEDAIDLLSKMIKYSPTDRITAEEALQHPYFKNSPLPTAPTKLPLPAQTPANPQPPQAQNEPKMNFPAVPMMS
eukprot:GFYU01016832.1.p1 GENE.GFYU01016832.1~~GFYU01016832.1.p1  ORF type:complete len:328 (+),score=71.32 GFYU01016832.1:85-1068(+)